MGRPQAKLIVKPELQRLILRLLDEHRIMTIATNRPDGWPQATVVGYANDGMLLYSFIGRAGQKYANIARDPRVSVAIAGDFADPLQIQGLSLAGKASFVEDKGEFERVAAIFLKRYPEYAQWPMPAPSLAPLLRVTPTVISVLDYSKGFGHSDLVNVTAREVTQIRHDWLTNR